MAASDAQLLALVRGHQETQARLAALAGEQVGTLWDRFGGLDDDAAARFSTAAAATVTAAQTTSAGLALGFVRSYVELADGPLDVDGLDPADDAAGARGGGVTPIDVYRRPVVVARTAIASGQSFGAAIAAGRARASTLANDDVVLAQRSGTSRAMDRAGDRVVGYRRVPRRGACSLCLAASTQRYRKRDLLPRHTRCHCGVLPLVGTRDPGRILEPELLAELKAASKRDDWWADSRLKAVVEDHGELGPVLVHAGDRFTGPKDLAA